MLYHPSKSEEMQLSGTPQSLVSADDVNLLGVI
jgi:hypothetical protein